MNLYRKRIDTAYRSARRIPIDNTARIVIISDCHRGSGNWADDFARNQNAYYAALSAYYRQGFTYIELGDGDELWEYNSIAEISCQEPGSMRVCGSDTAHPAASCSFCTAIRRTL